MTYIGIGYGIEKFIKNKSQAVKLMQANTKMSYLLHLYDFHIRKFTYSLTYDIYIYNIKSFQFKKNMNHVTQLK